MDAIKIRLRNPILNEIDPSCGTAPHPVANAPRLTCCKDMINENLINLCWKISPTKAIASRGSFLLVSRG
jgi:hypothetical protein